MSISVKELRLAIDTIRTQQLRTDHTLEYCEAVVAKAPLCIRGSMINDINLVREKNRQIREHNRKNLAIMERILEEDEAANWWKGEDRTIEP